MLILAAAAAAGSAFISYQESQAFQDRILRRAAFSPDGRPPPEPKHGRPERIEIQRPQGPQLVPLAGLADGYHDVQRGSRRYRLFVQTRPDGRTAALQPADLRRNNALAAAFITAAPLLALIPLLLIVITVITKRTLAPVNRAAKALDERAERDNTPIAASELPAEIQSYTRAINRLLARNAQVIAQQQRFIADAAHELRTPLAALTLQVQRLQSLTASGKSADASEQLNVLAAGIARSRRLLEQLLTLAKSQHEPAAGSTHAQPVIRQTLETLLPLALAKDIDLGAAGAADPELPLPADALFLVLKNLTDNAIRYSPAGSRIDIEALDTPELAGIAVRDNGKGIAPEERSAVLAPFHRLLGTETEGTGLGLAIVSSIAGEYGASLSLTDTEGGGLTALFTFPKAGDTTQKN